MVEEKVEPPKKKGGTTTKPPYEVVVADMSYNSLPDVHRPPSRMKENKAELHSIIKMLADNNLEYGTIRQTAAAMEYGFTMFPEDFQDFKLTALYKVLMEDPGSIRPLSQAQSDKVLSIIHKNIR